MNNIMKVEIMGYARESGVILIIEPLSIRYSSHAITRRPLANTDSARAGIRLYDPPTPHPHPVAKAQQRRQQLARAPYAAHGQAI